jgi:hypothetical protein
MGRKKFGHFKNCLIMLCCWGVFPINAAKSAPQLLSPALPDTNNLVDVNCQFAPPVPAIANNLSITYDSAPLNLKILKDVDCQRKLNVITADSIERFPIFRKAMPSLWWTQDQLPNKLILNWLAYPKEKRIDLVVNPQFWNNLEYLGRYQLINRYGLVARRYGYNVRIFNLKFSEAQPIVAYTCSSATAKSTCYVQWQEINQRSLKPDTSK